MGAKLAENGRSPCEHSGQHQTHTGAQEDQTHTDAHENQTHTDAQEDQTHTDAHEQAHTYS